MGSQYEIFINNVNALEEIKINLRTVHTAKIQIQPPRYLVEACFTLIAAPMTGVSYMGGGMSNGNFLIIS